MYVSYVVSGNINFVSVKTAHSINFEINAKLVDLSEISKHSGSSPIFFSIGFKIASFKISGNMPDDNDVSMMFLVMAEGYHCIALTTLLELGPGHHVFLAWKWSMFVYHSMRVAQTGEHQGRWFRYTLGCKTMIFWIKICHFVSMKKSFILWASVRLSKLEHGGNAYSENFCA